MLDIGWSEMAVIALVALVVIGPKDLPKAMKAVAYWVTKARRLSAEFHRGIDQIVREAELEEAREAIRSASQVNLDRELAQTLDPTGEVAKSLEPPADAAVSLAPPTVSAPEPPQQHTASDRAAALPTPRPEPT